MSILGVVCGLIAFVAVVFTPAGRLIGGIFALIIVGFFAFVGALPHYSMEGYEKADVDIRGIDLDQRNVLKALIVNRGDKPVYLLTLAVSVDECNATGCDKIAKMDVTLRPRSNKSIQPGDMEEFHSSHRDLHKMRQPLMGGVLRTNYEIIGISG